VNVLPSRLPRTADIAVIGAGLAGLRAAITLADHGYPPLLLCKGRLLHCGSSFCNRNGRWGYTFAADEEEQEQLFATIQRISRGTNDARLSRLLVEESSTRLEELRQWGVQFRADDTGALLRSPACFHPRPVAAILEDMAQLRACCLRRLLRRPPLVLDRVEVTELLVRGKRLRGLRLRRGNDAGELAVRAAVLACGGDGACCRPNMVETGLTGDGYRLLQQAGVMLHNMACHQAAWEDIDPTAPRFQLPMLWDPRYRLLAADGSPICLPPPGTELAKARLEHVPISNLQEDRLCDEALLRHIPSGSPDSAVRVLDLAGGRVVHRIMPHVMCCNGGVLIAPDGATPVAGLYAAGEVATGMHGGDRVGGLMITATQVFGRRAALGALDFLKMTRTASASKFRQYHGSEGP